MIKRQLRMQRIADVALEYLAALTAADWLRATQDADPHFGQKQGWEAKAGMAFCNNLEATYIIRMYAEFEAGLRDYWMTHRNQTTHPKMVQLVRHAVPDQSFSQDCIDDADDVRQYRNFLVHDIEEEPPEALRIFTIAEAKRCLCAYFGRLDPRWK
jgi:hypothetical protein